MEGKVLKGRYEMSFVYDSGGMSIIYRGTDLKTGKAIAVKVLKKEFSNDRSYVVRFMKEAKAIASLRHKNIVRMLDSGSEGGMYYIIFEFIEGVTLKQKIEMEGPMNYEIAAQIMIDVCSAIECAHSRGIIHRDIKPQNILVQKDGTVKLTDFGIAKDTTAATQTGGTEVMGSAHYFSPEQAMGEKVDARSDIYSLGIVLYELTTGKVPFDGDSSVAVAIKHINEPIREPKEIIIDVPKSINAIILKATRKDKEKRYSSAGELKADLTRALVTPEGNFVKIAKEQNGKEKKKRSIFPLISILVFCAIILVSLLIIGTNILNNKSLNSVLAPSLLGLDEAVATEDASKIGVKLDKQYQTSEGLNDKGRVISQNPGPGEQMESNGIMTIVISLGPREFEAPSVVNEELEAAKKLIDESDLVVGDIIEEESDKPAGYVISQQPEAGVNVTRGDVINLVISAKAKGVNADMPALVDMDFDSAIKMLIDAGFTSALVYEEPATDDKSAGTIYSQSPAAGVSANTYDPVTLWAVNLADKKYKAITTINLTVTEDDSLVRVTVENDYDGMTVNFCIYEGKQPKGELKLPMVARSNVMGVQDMVVYVNKEEVQRKSVEFK